MSHTRRLLSLGLLVLLTLATGVHAQSPSCAAMQPGQAVAHEMLTVSTTPIGFTAATITSNAAIAAYITMEGGSMRYLPVGTPSATVGHLADPPSGGNAGTGSGSWICGQPTLLSLRMIRTGSTDVVLRVTYYKQYP